MGGQTLIERAYELADSGTVENTTDLRIQLAKEGFGYGMIISTFQGRTLQAAIRKRIAASQRPEARQA
ncbi:MAG TPA: hypothetical protein VGB49_01390 [Caulobacteraceae bacterium]|jgi:hypothetical protein